MKMDNQRSQPARKDNRAAFVLQLVLLFLMMALSALIGLIWFGGDRLLFPPTPTPTATVGLQRTSAPDFRATLIAEDRATQVAYSTLAVQLGLPPLGVPTKRIEPTEVLTNAIILPVVIGDSEVMPATAVASTGNGATEGGVTISLPMVVNSSILPTPIPTPVVFSELPTETPTITPTLTTLPLLPTDTATLLPPTPTLMPTPTFFVNSQKAIIVATSLATLRAGPSNLYGSVGTLANGVAVNLIGRDETGEWVVVCCLDNAPRWLRQVYAPPRDNQPQPGAPPGATPNDVRWLKVEIPPPTTVPLLTPTPIPDNSFPLYRRDRGNSGRVAKLPTWPLIPAWPNPNRAEQPMISSIVVANDRVLVASADNHLYALGTGEGSQQWRFNVGARVQFAPTVQENFVYFVDAQKRTFALQDLGNHYTQVWQKSIPGDALTGLYLANNRLFVIVRDGAPQDRLYALDRNTGDSNGNYTGVGKMAPVMAIGNQLVYIGDPDLRALDTNDLSVVWVRDEIENLLAPPVYVLNGPNALAELYVVDSPTPGNVRLHAINANTGQIIWTTPLGRDVNGLAVGDTAVYVTGDNFMRAIVRQGGNATLWEVGIAGRAMGGPLIDGSQILVVTNAGSIQGVNLNGQTIGNQFLPNGLQVIGSPAVSGVNLYIPANDSIVYAFRGQP